MKNIITNIILILVVIFCSSFTDINAMTLNNIEVNKDEIHEITREKLFNETYKNMIKERERKAEEERLRLEAERIQKENDLNCYVDISDITKPSNISVQRAYELLEGTTFQTWEIAQHYVDAEKDYPCVNAIFNISMARHESSHGKSKVSAEKNNVTSVSYSNKPGIPKEFNRKYDSIVATTNLLKSQYLDPNGDWYTGKSIYDVGYHYYGKFDGHDWAGNVIKMIEYLKNNY